MGTVHIVGAGLAGLSTAVRLCQAGQNVTIWEASAFAGGRCRTFWDPRLERHVDNGNHLVLSGNRSTRSYLDAIGAAGQMEMADRSQLLAHCDYGGPVTAIVGRDTMVGTQFHPEKSQTAGLRLIANWLNWTP